MRDTDWQSLLWKPSTWEPRQAAWATQKDTEGERRVNFTSQGEQITAAQNFL